MRLRAAVICWALAAVAMAAPTTGPTTATTAHYSLECDGLAASEVGALLEAFFPLASEFFGASPRERMEFRVYRDSASFLAALKREGIDPGKAGGYYSPRTRTAYCFPKPSAYFTRHIILHEATHQFESLTSRRRHGPESPAYVEGIAEYLAMHNWDGQRLSVGVVPAITLEDYPATALKSWLALPDRDLRTAWGKEALTDRPEAWSFVAFLAAQNPAALTRWRKDMLAGASNLEAYDRAMEGVAKPGDAYERWLRGHQQPWKVEWIGWQQRGDLLEGVSPAATTALATVKTRCDGLRVVVESREAGARAGLVFDFTSTDSYSVIQVDDAGVTMAKRQLGRWGPVSRVAAARPGNKPILWARSKGNTLTIGVGDLEVTSLRSDGRLGISAERGRVNFRPTIEARESPTTRPASRP